jgi:hypothetical protein
MSHDHHTGTYGIGAGAVGRRRMTGPVRRTALTTARSAEELRAHAETEGDRRRRAPVGSAQASLISQITAPLETV